MRTDLLSKRIYYAGFLGLPWLWIVHVLYWRSNETDENEGLLNPDDHFPDDSPTEMTTEEITMEAQKWVQRCKYSAAVFVCAWIGWIVAAQLLRGTLPAYWYVLSPNDAQLTGW